MKANWHKHLSLSTGRHGAGMMLIEVLVTLVIISVGLPGAWPPCS